MRVAPAPAIRPYRAAHRIRGLTLVEAVVVVALVAVGIGATAFAVSGSLDSQRIQSAGQDLVAALRYTRGKAIVAREPQALELDVEARTYQAPERDLVQLPRGMEMRLLTAAMEQTGETSGRIRFYPDGSSTGGRIKLVRGGRAWDIEVAWLTGEVRMREGRP
jgi:general secretion pathway protein H